MKKALKIFLGILLVIVISLALIPFLFQDKITALIKETINNNLNANVDFSDSDLSLFRDFPKASVRLSNISVINKEPFKGDTLFFAKQIDLSLELTQLLKSSSGELNIKSFNVDAAKINVLVDVKGNANYDIAKPSKEKTEKDTESSSGNISIESYAIENSIIGYNDKQGKLSLILSEFNHSGKGDFSAKKTQLDTKTATKISFTMGKSKYIENMYLDLNAVIDADLEHNKFSFLNNEAHINQLPLVFDGFVKLNDNSQEVDLNFKTPSSDFKNFLALVPKEYAKNIADVKTTGNFGVIGKVQGIVDETHIPKIDININSNNASFRFPNLPKSVQNIQINTTIKNTTGIVENTFVTINNLSFKIDENTFNGKANIKNLTTNPTVNATVKGKLNLADISKVYPLELEQKLSGIIEADIETSFDTEAIQKNIYQRIKNNGKISINDFVFDSKDVVNPINIKNAEVDFQPTTIKLTKFDAKTGTTDLQGTGSLENFLGFILSDKKLKGKFNLSSNEFRLSDFMETTTEDSTTKNTEKNVPTETLKIPAFLDCAITANAKKVYYDNLILENVKGDLILKNETATLNNLTAGIFEGTINLNGTVNTQEKTPKYDMKLGINAVDITQSFTQIAMLKAIAPIAGVLEGKLNTNINLKGTLKDDFTPNLSTISGDALAQLLTQKVNPKNSKVMSLLGDKVNFVDLKKLNIDNIKTNLSFKNGKVNVKPFDVKYKDMNIKIGGSHSFDEAMNYDVTFDVPTKYLGTKITGLVSKLGAKEQNGTVPITAILSGSFTNPSIKTDMKSAISTLTTQLIKKQKEKLIGNAIGGLLGGKKSKKETAIPTTKKEAVKEVKKEVKKKVEKGVKDILGGFFGKKKKGN